MTFDYRNLSEKEWERWIAASTPRPILLIGRPTDPMYSTAVNNLAGYWSQRLHGAYATQSCSCTRVGSDLYAVPDEVTRPFQEQFNVEVDKREQKLLVLDALREKPSVNWVYDRAVAAACVALGVSAYDAAEELAVRTVTKGHPVFRLEKRFRWHSDPTHPMRIAATAYWESAEKQRAAEAYLVHAITDAITALTSGEVLPLLPPPTQVEAAMHLFQEVDNGKATKGHAGKSSRVARASARRS